MKEFSKQIFTVQTISFIFDIQYNHHCYHLFLFSFLFHGIVEKHKYSNTIHRYGLGLNRSRNFHLVITLAIDTPGSQISDPLVSMISVSNQYYCWQNFRGFFWMGNLKRKKRREEEKRSKAQRSKASMNHSIEWYGNSNKKKINVNNHQNQHLPIYVLVDSCTSMCQFLGGTSIERLSVFICLFYVGMSEHNDLKTELPIN